MTVHVLTILHRHGENVYVHKTHDGAKKRLISYIYEWWDEIDPSTDPPTDDDIAINTYFEKKEDESYNFMEMELGE